MKELKKEKIVRSKMREGLITNVWNHLRKGYEYKYSHSGWYFENGMWCTEMKLKQHNQ